MRILNKILYKFEKLMLHEILYALLGYTGDVIILQNEQFIVNPSLYTVSQGKNGVGFNITQDNLLSLSEV